MFRFHEDPKVLNSRHWHVYVHDIIPQSPG
jgi:hypothetical protein